MCLSTLWFNPTPSKSHSKKNANDHNEFQLFFFFTIKNIELCAYACAQKYYCYKQAGRLQPVICIYRVIF